MSNNFPPAAEKIVNDYLERLREHLRGMSNKDQQEILAEISSHIYESYSSDSEGDEIDRALRSIRKLGEPADVLSSHIAPEVSRLGRERKSLLYILGGALIIMFAAPIGIGGLGVAAGFLAALLGLVVSYFAVAIALVLSGLAGFVAGLIAIFSPEFYLRINDLVGESVVRFGPFEANPVVAGVLVLIVSLIMAGLGLLMLWSWKHIWRGVKFTFNFLLEKIRSVFARGFSLKKYL